MRCAFHILILGLLLSALPLAEARGAELVIGNDESPWEEWGGQLAYSLAQGGREVPDQWVDWAGLGFQPASGNILARIDAITDPGWLQPVRIDPSMNVVLGFDKRAPRVKVLADRSSFRGQVCETCGVSYAYIDAFIVIADGDVNSYLYNRAGEEYKRHTMLHFDLGWDFPINRVHFFTREGFELLQIPAYTLAVAEGDWAFYDPIGGDATGYTYWDQAITNWTVIAEEVTNTEHDVDISLPTQYARYVAIGDTLIAGAAKTRWEIAEFEVYGEGYLSGFTYTSVVIPFANAANWGALRWHAEVDSGATVSLRTRSGQTPNPYRYFVKTGIGPTGQMEVTREEYRATKMDHNRKALAGPVVEDTDNWSFWSLPYTQSGQTITSPAPARYFQFELVVASSDPQARARVDSVVVEFSSPPVAQELVGELGYEAVRPGQWEQFRYALRARFGAADTGFDAVRIFTPDQVDSASIGGLAVNGTEVVPEAVEMAADGFTLILPEHVGPATAGDSALVQLAFATRVFVHGTNLLGSVFDSKAPVALAQSIQPGDATDQLDTDHLRVEWELGGSLVGSVQVSANPFTPNGDGVNDQARFDYGLFQVDRPVPVSFTVHDLAGRVMYRLTRDEGSGPRSVRWAGLDDSGKLVAPGLYVWQITVDTAVDEYVESGTVAVAY